LLNSFLYILRPRGEPGELEKIARSNGVTPLLWEILLADAIPALTADLTQVLGAAAGTWIAADSHRGHARLRCFTRLMQQYPYIGRVPALRRYLAGAQQHLGDLIAAWTVEGEPTPVLCLNLDELSATDPAARSSCVTAQLAHFAEQWHRLESTLGAGDFNALEERLNSASLNLSCADWKTWAGQFGLALFSHEYFDHAFRRPLEGEYVDHQYDMLGTADCLGDGIHRYKSQGKWGVCRRAGDHEAAVLDAQWDRILRAGADEEELVWIRRGKLFGLAAVAGNRAGQVLLEPVLAEVGAFSDGLAVVRMGKKVGFLGRSGEWHLQPSWDEAWPFVQGHAVVVVDDRLGFIDARGVNVVAAQFDAADDFTAAGVARVRQRDRYGLIRTDGSFVVPLRYGRLVWSQEFTGWLGHADAAGQESPTLLHPDGTSWLDEKRFDEKWQSLEVMVPLHSVLVRQKDRVGLLRWNGEPLLDCVYDELLPHFTPSQSIQFIARRGDKVGLIDAAGMELVPFEFSAIECLEPHVEDGHALRPAGLVRVWSMPGKSKPLAGVWDTERGACIVPCGFDSVWIMQTGTGAGHRFVVITENPRGQRGVRGKYRVGILREDGSTLVPQDYAWIGERTALNREEAIQHLRGAIYHAWSGDSPVEAATQRNGPSVWIYRDGLVQEFTATHTQ
jgi:hypothetical protein